MDVSLSINKFIALLKAGGYADSTLGGRSLELELFKRYLKSIDITDLRKVSAHVIFDYQQKVMAQPFSLERKMNRLRPVKQLFEHLSESHRLLINPAEGVDLRCRKHSKIGTVLSLVEIKRLFAQPKLTKPTHLRDRAIMEVLYSSGIRLKELLGLTCTHADLSEKLLYIKNGKGGKQRLVPLGDNAAGYLKQYLDKVRPRYGKKHPQETRLFLNHFGKPLRRGGLRTRLQVYRRQAGIDKRISPQTFRRTCATHMLQQGADIRYIQMLLGHAKLSTTQQYTKIRPIDIKAVHTKTHPNATGERP
jgi:integrase/recombinase XerD